jgi:hypothetical protein
VTIEELMRQIWAAENREQADRVALAYAAERLESGCFPEVMGINRSSFEVVEILQWLRDPTS